MEVCFSSVTRSPEEGSPGMVQMLKEVMTTSCCPTYCSSILSVWFLSTGTRWLFYFWALWPCFRQEDRERASGKSMYQLSQSIFIRKSIAFWKLHPTEFYLHIMDQSRPHDQSWLKLVWGDEYFQLDMLYIKQNWNSVSSYGFCLRSPELALWWEHEGGTPKLDWGGETVVKEGPWRWILSRSWKWIWISQVENTWACVGIWRERGEKWDM